MPEEIVKQKKVTFGTGHPLGNHATFTHDGQLWIAYPQKKNVRILTVIDRMLGIYNRLHEEMTRWINEWPTDGKRVAAALEMIARAQSLQQNLIIEKCEATIE